MEIALAVLQSDIFGTPAYFWLTFVGLVVGLIAFDLGILHKGKQEIGAKESFLFYCAYVAIAVAFGGWVWWSRGAQSGLEFFTGYVIEQSLAMDNIFVIAAIFTYFAIPRLYQHQVLFWGVIGAILMRALMIGLGSALLSQFSWILYLFGAFLVFTGFKLFRASEGHGNIADNPVLGFLRRRFNITNELHGHHFTVRRLDATTGKSSLWPAAGFTDTELRCF